MFIAGVAPVPGLGVEAGEREVLRAGWGHCDVGCDGGFWPRPNHACTALGQSADRPTDLRTIGNKRTTNHIKLVSGKTFVDQFKKSEIGPQKIHESETRSLTSSTDSSTRPPCQ